MTGRSPVKLSPEHPFTRGTARGTLDHERMRKITPVPCSYRLRAVRRAFVVFPPQVKVVFHRPQGNPHVCSDKRTVGRAHLTGFFALLYVGAVTGREALDRGSMELAIHDQKSRRIQGSVVYIPWHAEDNKIRKTLCTHCVMMMGSSNSPIRRRVNASAGNPHLGPTQPSVGSNRTQSFP